MSTRATLSVSVEYYEQGFAEISPLFEVEIRLIEKRQKQVRTINGLNVLIEDEVVQKESKVFRNMIDGFLLPELSERIVFCMLSDFNVGRKVKDFLTKQIESAAKKLADLAIKNGFSKFAFVAVVESVVVESFDEGVDESQPHSCRCHLPKKRCIGELGGSFGEVCNWVKG